MRRLRRLWRRLNLPSAPHTPRAQPPNTGLRKKFRAELKAIGANADGACAGGWNHPQGLGTSRSRSANVARVKVCLATPGGACSRARVTRGRPPNHRTAKYPKIRAAEGRLSRRHAARSRRTGGLQSSRGVTPPSGPHNSPWYQSGDRPHGGTLIAPATRSLGRARPPWAVDHRRRRPSNTSLERLHDQCSDVVFAASGVREVDQLVDGKGAAFREDGGDLFER